MPIPIICLEASLRQYADSFRGVFSSPQFQHFVTVLLGLVMTPERRSLRGLVSCVAGSGSLSALSRFFTLAPWSAEEVAKGWMDRFGKRLLPQIQAEHARQRAQRPRKRGKPRPSRVTAFVIFDDTTIPKHTQGKGGRRMAAVGKHYSTSANGTVQGHSLVAGLIVLLGRRCPLPPMLYRQKRVALAEGVGFHSKVDLVVEAIRSFTPVQDTLTHILVDAWYTSHAVWRAACERGFVITGGIRVNRWLRLPDPQRPGCYRKLRLSDYIQMLGPDDFVVVPWRGRWVAAHLVRTFVYKLGAAQVLIIKATKDAPSQTARCFATSDLTADVATVASYAACRWDIETWIGDVKGLLGLDHHQLTSAEAIMRFWHLVCCLYVYLDEVRARLIVQGYSTATTGDALRHQQQAQYHLLLQWLKEQFVQGDSVDHVETLLAA